MDRTVNDGKTYNAQTDMLPLFGSADRKGQFMDVIADAADVDDAEHTYAIRTKFGNGPVIFVKGVKSDNGRHDVRKWYAWAHGINYFEVRECSFEHWANNPDTQIATNL
jgi:hypothetical protein